MFLLLDTAAPQIQSTFEKVQREAETWGRRGRGWGEGPVSIQNGGTWDVKLQAVADQTLGDPP